MASSKKIISLILAVAMVIGVFAISAFAVAPAATITLSADNAQVESGDTITITVTATAGEDFYVGPFGIPVEFDSELVTFVSATVANVFGSGTTDYAVNSANSATTGKVAIAGWPTNNGSPVAPNLNGTNVVLATLTFTAKADGEAVFAIANDQKTTANPTGLFYMGSFDGSNPKTAALTEMGQTLTAVSTTVTIGSAEPELILTATGEANGVKIDTNKTFGGAYAGVIYGFPQPAANTFRTIGYITTNLTTTAGAITAADLARTVGTAGYGTGTTITVGSKVYVIVIFGDANGDGLINANDTSTVKGYANGGTIPSVAQRMAANCQQINNATMLFNINANDTAAVKAYVTNKANKFSPATLAGYMFSKNAANAYA